MKQNEIKDLPALRTENYENLFNVYQDFERDGMYYYNILQTINFPTNLPEGLFRYYTIIPGDTWPYISYKEYGTPNLWWIILFANQILDPTRQLISGDTILIPVSQVVTETLTQIRKSKQV